MNDSTTMLDSRPASNRPMARALKWSLGASRYVISLALIGFIIYRIGARDTLAACRNISLQQILWVVAAGAGVILVHSIRNHWLIRRLLPDTTYLHNLKAYAAGLGVGTITPGRVGEAVRVIFYPQHKTAALAALFVERLCMVWSLSLAATLSSALLAPAFLPAAAGLSFVISLLFIFRRTIVVRLEKFFKTGSPWRLLFSSINRYSIFQLGLSAFLCFFCLAFQSFQLYVLLNAGGRISYSVMALVFPLVLLFTLLPISIGGVGLREGALLFFLSRYAVPPGQVVAASLLFYLMYAVPFCLLASILIHQAGHGQRQRIHIAG